MHRIRFRDALATSTDFSRDGHRRVIFEEGP
jgi:hypothetical protein